MPSTVTIQLTDEQIALLTLAASGLGVTPGAVISDIIERALKVQLLRINPAALSPAAAAISNAVEGFATPSSVTITKT
jgi:3-dehydroquinate dehydratase